MKKTVKSLFASVQVIACVLALCLNVSATSNSSAYNDGERHVTCSSLSEAAENYYTNYTYEVLSEQASSELLISLRELMKSTHTYEASYNDSRDKASLTDSMSNDGRISLLYTSALVTRADFGGNTGTWNREHVWPKSLGGFGNSGAGADLHHVRPSDAAINSKRDNLQFGNVQSGAIAQGSSLVNGVSGGTYSNPYFEPVDNVKGDVARICLYVYARYGGELTKCNSITNVFQSVDVLLEWCELDPVDEWEMSRNDVVEAIQGNRNVFIDYPEYAWLIFDREVPDEMVTPSGEAAQSNGSPSQGNECTHAFDSWESVGNGEMMRMCTICAETEFAPLDENAITDKSDGKLINGIVVVAIVLSVAVTAGIGILVYRCLVKKRNT